MKKNYTHHALPLAGQPATTHSSGQARGGLYAMAFVAFGFLIALANPVSAAGGLPDFEKLVAENGPAVVKISVTGKRQGMVPSQQPGNNGQELPEFFRRFYDNMPQTPRQAPRQSAGFGSGFVMSSDGYIVTNAHVVDNAAEILVSFPNQREWPAELIGADERTDIALLKIDASGLPTLQLGDSSELNVGQWVLAIGSPFGFEYTATQGIVSALSRSLPDGNYVPFIQTDVAVNPGNSGGPLFDLEGNVVGVNSQIYSRSGGYQGLSFAIPVNVVKNVTAQLKNQGFVSRGWLGVVIQNVDQTLAESFGMDRPAGALVAKVTDNSPASAAGVEAGDIILSFNGQPIARSSNLPPLVGATVVGEPAEMEVLRAGQRINLSVVIAELEEDRQINPARVTQPTPDARLGLNVEPLGQQQREQSGVQEGGVLITRVDPNGVAAVAGIQQGDILISFNQQPVMSVEKLRDQVAAAPTGKPIAVLINRGSNPLFTALTLN